MLSRRDLLKQGVAGLTAFLIPNAFPRRASAATSAPVLMMLYLRGGADGLNLVVPAGDPLYYSNRPHIQVPPGSELALDGFFGLNPALAPILPHFLSGELCIVHACGSPDPSRSHFDAQDFMDYGAPGNPTIRTGWLNRVLLSSGETDPVAAIGIGYHAPSLVGAAPSLTMAKLAAFTITGEFQSERRAALEGRYSLEPGSLLGAGALDAFAALDRITAIDRTTSVAYPAGSAVAASLRDAAALIKADIGVRFVTVAMGGWDHHASEVYVMDLTASDLANSLAAFYQDLGESSNATLTLCVSEFGRRVRENSQGTDHGRGGVMLALGGGVAGGRVITRDGWPGLAPEQLDRGQDLAVTTDFRDVFSEVLHRHMGLSIAQLGPVFPDFSVDPANFPGLYA
jgi:uncharacterized protein (DUF1501 family)